MKTNPTTSLPKSKAKTAYALLSEVRKLILAEPLRYDQREVLAFSHIETTSAIKTHERYPSCGTVGCVAGWVVALKSKQPSRVYHVMDYAARVLGLNYQKSDHLFNANAAAGTSQTREHAREGAKHIARFQKEHRKQLIAKKIR